MTRIHKTRFSAALSLSAFLGVMFATSASAEGASNTLFSEDFEGYTDFTHSNLGVDPKYNPGVPLISEGAKETWYGAYFETPNVIGDVTEDLGVQSPIWYEPAESNTGRFSNDAGLLFRIDTSNVASSILSFEWHTYEPVAGDNFRAGYFAGSLPGSDCDDAEGCVFDFSGESDFWSSWTELVSGQFIEPPEGGGMSESFTLPGGVSELWVAFWMDSDEATGVCPYYYCGLAKIDNVMVTATAPVPVPAAVWLFGTGLLGLVGVARCREEACKSRDS